MDRLIADTGFLVAFGRARDPRHDAAKRFLQTFRGRLVTVAPVVVESCFFLSPHSKQLLLEWIRLGGVGVVDVPVAAYSELSITIGTYANRDIDFTDAALVWLAEQAGLRGILTLDRADFSTFRLKGGKRFEPISWC